MRNKREKRARVLGITALLTALLTIIPLSVSGGQQKAGETLVVQVTHTDGAESNNTFWGTDRVRGSEPEYAYLEPWGNGGWSRVEYLPDDSGSVTNGTLIVDNYDSSYTLQEQKVIDFRMCTGKLDNTAKMKEAIFGGVFLGETNNFVVIGWNNLALDETVEVLRVIKYSKDWSRQIAHRSFYDLNTKRIFSLTCAENTPLSCRMTEKDGFLFIHTGQCMSKGAFYGHQASLTIRLNEDMKSDADDRINCGTIWEMEGYVSHSFDQYAASDDEAVYFADLGDGAPRAVRLISRYGDEKSGCEEHVADVLDIIGRSGYNFTGVTLMDMTTAGGNVLLVGNTVDQSDVENIKKDTERTLFLAVGDPTLEDTRLIYLSDAVDANSAYTRAHLVNGQKDDELYLIWETGEADAVDTTYLVPIDARGNVIGTRGFEDPYVIHAGLSNVNPMMSEDGKIVWYCTEDEQPYFVSVDTTRLSELDSYEGISLDACEAVYTDELTYEEETGAPIVTSLKYGDYELVEFRDYRIEYLSRAHVGVNEAVIRGIGVFSGEIEWTFTLLPHTPENLEQSRGTATSITMKWDAVAEASGYEISLYQNGTLVTSQKKSGTNGSITFSKLPSSTTYQCKVRAYTMQGDQTYYSDYVQETVRTAVSGDEEQYDIANCCNIYVSKEATLEEGQDAIPEVSLYYKQHRLQEGYDYRLDYENQSALGTGLVIITGMDEFNGTVVRSYAIVPKKQDEEPDSGEDDTEDDAGVAPSFLTLTEEMAAGAEVADFEQGTDTAELERVTQLAPGEEVIYRVTPKVSAVYYLSYQKNSGHSYWRVYNQDRSVLYGYNLSSDIRTGCAAALAAGRTYYFRFTNYQEQDAEFEWDMHWYPAENLVLERTSDTDRDNAVMPIIYGNLTNGKWENGQFYFYVIREYYHYDPYTEYYVGDSKAKVDVMYTELSNNAAELQAQSLWSEGNTYPVTVNFGNVSAQMPVRIWGGIEYIESILQPEYYTLNERKVIKPEETEAYFLYTAEESGQYQFHLQDTGELVPGPDGDPESIEFSQMYFDEYYNMIDENYFSHEVSSLDTPTEAYFDLEKGRTYYMIIGCAPPDWGVEEDSNIYPETYKKYDWEYSLAVQTDIEAKELPDVYEDYVIPTWVYGDTSSGAYEGDTFVFSDEMLRGQLVLWEDYSSGINREISADDVTVTSNQRQTPWTAGSAKADHQVTISENGFEKTLTLSLNIETPVENYLQEYAKNEGVVESVDADVTSRAITERDICLVLQPKETKEYLLYGNDADPKSSKKTAEATLYDENMQVIAESNQDQEHHYYLIKKKLEAGRTYYLRLVQNSYRSINYIAGILKTEGCQFRMLNTDYVDTLYYGSKSDGYWKDGNYYFSDERVRQLEMPMLIGSDFNCAVPADYLTVTWQKANGQVLPGQTVSLTIGFEGWQAQKKVRIADLKEYYCDYNAPVLTVGDNKKNEIWYFGEKEYNGCAFFDADTAGTYTFASSEAKNTSISIEDTANGKVLAKGTGTVSCHLTAGQSCLLRLSPAAGTESTARTVTITQKADGTGGETSTGGSSGDSSSGNEEDNTGNPGNTDSSDDTGISGGSTDAGTGNTSASVQKRWKIGGAYYTGKLSSGKVAYAGPVKKTVTTVKIPNTVKISGKNYKVTSIAKTAFKDCKKLKTVTIGTNVTSIGDRAFYNCKKLSSVTIKGTKLKTVGKNALKGTKKKIKVTVPKKKYTAYKKLLKKAGMNSPVYKKSK